MNTQTKDDRVVDGTHVRVYDGKKYVSSIDLPRVDARRVLCGLLDIRDAENTSEEGYGLSPEIPSGFNYYNAPKMLTHCIECLETVDAGREDDSVCIGIRFNELMGALVAAQEYMRIRDETISTMMKE